MGGFGVMDLLDGRDDDRPGRVASISSVGVYIFLSSVLCSQIVCIVSHSGPIVPVLSTSLCSSLHRLTNGFGCVPLCSNQQAESNQ